MDAATLPSHRDHRCEAEDVESLTIWILAAVGVTVLAVAVAIAVHDFFEGENLIHDLVDEWRLRRRTLEDFDAQWSAAPRRSEVIVSLTTIPSRLPHLEWTLKSLMRQTVAPARIVLNLPRFSRREGCAYEVPERLRTLAAVEIREVEDLGPATKLVPTLLAEPADRMIVTLDDDRIYPAKLIETLERAARADPDGAFAFGGWIVPADYVDRPTTVASNFFMRPPAPVRATRLGAPKAVDVPLGFCGYLVRPRFFDLAALTDWSAAPDCAFFVDDVWIGAHCRADIRVVPSRLSNYQPKLLRPFYRETSLGRINRGSGGHEMRHNTIVLRHFRNVWRVGGDRLARTGSTRRS